jgi:imidazole glycerol phosphate synthase glutamine amidotransferase subunit
VSDRPATVTVRPRLALVDHGAGNLVSIEQALVAAGATVVPGRGPADLAGVDGVVLPGVGAAAPAMARLARQDLVEPLQAWVRAGRPLLGICLGLQLLFEGSDEDGAETLGLLAGRSVRLSDAPTLPHIGWNQVRQLRDDPLLDGIDDGADLYFVHSYAVRPAPSDAAVVLARTEHGGEFVSAVARGPLYGVQFHPERSGRDGLRLLRNFVSLVATTTPVLPPTAATGRPAAGALLP